MQATLSRSPCAAAAQPGAAQRPAAQAQACLHGTAALRQRRAAAGLQGVQQRRGVAAAAAARRPRLAVAASSTYGSEWSTPQDAYLTVVSGGVSSPTSVAGMLAGTGPARPMPPPPALCPSAALPCPQGLSHCYAKNDDGKLVDQYMIEPITANSLEGMANGERGCPACCAWFVRACCQSNTCNHASQPSVPGAQLLTLRCLGPMSFPPSPAGAKTSFVHVFSLRLGEALARDKSVFPEEFAQVRWGLGRQHAGGQEPRRLNSSRAAAVAGVRFICLLAQP